MAGLDPKAWINLSKVTALVVEPNDLGMQILKQILAGFGVRQPICLRSGEEALDYARQNEINLVIASDQLSDMTGYDFVRNLRRANLEPNSFTPVIIATGHVRKSQVAAARDCGANFVVARPTSPQVLLERVFWVSQEGRPFVDTGKYLGPDRRFKEGEQDKSPARRREDAPPSSSGGPT